MLILKYKKFISVSTILYMFLFQQQKLWHNKKHEKTQIKETEKSSETDSDMTWLLE